VENSNTYADFHETYKLKHEVHRTNNGLTKELLYKDEVYAIVGACIEVHRELGAGFAEAVYQEAMEIEFTERNIPFLPQKGLSVFYKGTPLRKYYIPDFISERKSLLRSRLSTYLPLEKRVNC
jgi:GxxExxY protein